MAKSQATKAEVLTFPKSRKRAEQTRKSGLNHNKFGSVRNFDGKVGVDFIYLDERVRESSGLPWNEKNAKEVRGQLDKIGVMIKDGNFRFAEVFPQSKKRQFFEKREREVFQLKTTPEDVPFEGYAWKWLELLEAAGRVTGRTLREYKSYLRIYLVPFFGEKSFAHLNARLLEEFVSWSRKQMIKGKPVGNKSINKYLVPMRMICNAASIEFQWGSGYDPFFGFKRLPEEDAIEKVHPFSIEEQKKLRQELPDHWKPYFDFAFRAGLRPGEQIALKPEDIDWEKGLLHVQRAITLDRDGKRTEGNTKNKHSRRTIKLTAVMKESLVAQRKIQERFGSEFFFCTPNGCAVHLSNLRKKVWLPALQQGGLPIREMKQTRHSFATTAVSCGEDPLWIARVMGHRDIEMVVKTYSRHVADNRGIEDGSMLSALYRHTQSGRIESDQ
jgi:integrase